MPASEVLKSSFLLQGRPDVLGELVTHLMAEHDMHRPLQLIVALLHHEGWRRYARCAAKWRMRAMWHRWPRSLLKPPGESSSTCILGIC